MLSLPEMGLEKNSLIYNEDDRKYPSCVSVLTQRFFFRFVCLYRLRGDGGVIKLFWYSHSASVASLLTLSLSDPPACKDVVDCGYDDENR